MAVDDRARGLALVGGTAALAYWLPTTAIVSAQVRRALGVRATVDAADGVALTFDDGPHPEATPRLLSLLEEARVRATFFLVGEQVERRPALAAEIAAAGHELAVHCHRHRNLMRVGPWRLRDDLDRAADAVAGAAGAPPRRYRPPYGIVTTAALLEARRRGWETVLWRRDGRDWQRRATPQRIADRLLGDVRGGDVLLVHDADFYSAPGSWRNTLAALPRVLDRLDALGLRVVPL